MCPLLLPVSQCCLSKVNMVLNVHTETIRLIRDGEKGERESIYLSLHCHHQNDSCIKMGSDESHFNVS